MPQASIPGKLKEYMLLYMEDGGPKRCDRCVMWVSDINRCNILGPHVEVKPNMICCLYVYGTPTDSHETQLRTLVTPEEVGLGQGDTSCGNCRYGDGAETCQHPALESFPIDNEGGCCNAWTPKPGESARD